MLIVTTITDCLFFFLINVKKKVRNAREISTSNISYLSNNTKKKYIHEIYQNILLARHIKHQYDLMFILFFIITHVSQMQTTNEM